MYVLNFGETQQRDDPPLQITAASVAVFQVTSPG